jgi:hypothetical protein
LSALIANYTSNERTTGYGCFAMPSHPAAPSSRNKKSRMSVRSRRCHVPQNLCCPIRSVTGYLCVTATNRWDVDFSVQPRRGCPCFLSARTARMTQTGTGGGRTWSHLTSVPRNRDGRFALFCSSTYLVLGFPRLWYGCRAAPLGPIESTRRQYTETQDRRFGGRHGPCVPQIDVNF